jgi:hypothetical protein
MHSSQSTLIWRFKCIQRLLTLFSLLSGRHPYIETLGSMYLMKIKHGDDFATTSGSVWRLLFVMTLFPWLRKHRLMTRPALVEGQSSQNEEDGVNGMARDDITVLEHNLVLADENARLKRLIGTLEMRLETTIDRLEGEMGLGVGSVDLASP